MRDQIANAFCWAHYGMDISIASRDVVQACGEFADKVLGLSIEKKERPMSDLGEPTPEQIQIVFNWLMDDEDDDPKKGGWWGVSDQVEDVKTLIRQLLTSFLTLPIEADCPECRGRGNHGTVHWDEGYRFDQSHDVIECKTCHGTGKLTIPLSEVLTNYPKLKAFWEQARELDK